MISIKEYAFMIVRKMNLRKIRNLNGVTYSCTVGAASVGKVKKEWKVMVN